MTTRDDLDPIEALQAARQAADPFRASMLARWPSLYAHLAAEPVRQCEPITREGFAIGKGWHAIVERLSAELAALAERLSPEERALVRVVQVKEKFGRLRVYLDDVETDEMRAAIDASQDESERTCEECGRPGRARTLRGWVSTRCEACWNAELERRASARADEFREAADEVLKEDAPILAELAARDRESPEEAAERAHDEAFRAAFAVVLERHGGALKMLAEHDEIVDLATHAGEVLFEEYVLPLRLTLADLAGRVGLPEDELAELLNRQRAVTPEIAEKLGAAFNTSAQFWLSMQATYERRRRGDGS
jgi:addiction module HigA family antidote